MVLCHLLANWKDRSPLVVITAQGSSVARTAKAAGIAVVELSFVPERIWPNVKEVEKSLKLLKQVKLIHAWNAKSFELGWYLSRRLGLKLTCTMHDHPRSTYLTAKKLWLLKTIANTSAGLVSVSRVLANECRAYGYRCSITTIHNGLPDQPAASLKKTEPVLNVGFLGMNSVVKGFSIVADWIRRTSALPQVQWHLFGDVCSQYTAMLRDLEPVATNFRVWGRGEPSAIFRQIDLLVHASTAFDCYPTVLLEAARAGVPAVASSTGGAGEIIEHGQTGFLFDPSAPESGFEFLTDLLNNANLLSAFSANARNRFVEEFGAEDMVAKYNRFWRKSLQPSFSEKHEMAE